MRPLESKKSIEGISRARMYIKKDLDLFTGYPDTSGGWISMPEGKEPAVCSIEREHIHNATFTVNKLVRDFPRALPKIVGDIEKWNTRYKSLLEIMKSSIHSGRPLPESAADLSPEFGEGDKKLYRKMLRDYPSLSHVFNSFSWITYLKPECFREALFWLNKNIGYAEGICKSLGAPEASKAIISLWRLSARVGDKRSEMILPWISDIRAFEIPMEQGYSYACHVDSLLGRKRNDPIPENPKARFGKDIVKWIGWLSLQDDKTVKRSVDLFETVTDIGLLGSWEQWWKLLNAAISDAEKIPRPLTVKDPLATKLNSIRDKIRKIGENPPPSINSKILFSMVAKWPESSKADDFGPISKALSALPVKYGNVPLRMAFLTYWDNLIDENNARKKRIILSIVKEFSQYIKSHGDFSKAIKLWEKVLDNWKAGGDPDRYVYTVDDEILDEINDETEVSMLFKVLRGLSLDDSIGELKEDEKRNIVLLFKLLDKERVPVVLSGLRKHGLSGEYLSFDLLRLAGEIAKTDCKSFAEVLKILINVSERYNDIYTVLRQILTVCRTPALETFLLDAVLGGQLKILCGIALKAGIMEYFGSRGFAPPPPITEDTGWIRRFPEELMDVLLRLASADANAEKTAGRILSRDFPDTRSLAEEIGKLTEMIDKGMDKEGFLGIRVENLKKRLEEIQTMNGAGEDKRDTHIKPGGQRLENLKSKLSHAAMMGLLKSWNEDIDTKFRTCIKNYLGLKEFPSWLEKSNIQEIILSTAELDPHFQRIVHSILVRRASDLPWDFRDAPENRAFMVKLEAAGINMLPWLEGNDCLTKKSKGGEEVIVCIERDPVEVFSMGLYFKTCLSPGGINFFSVFSNIIDINKQVIYGKTRGGSVKARALIALTDEGGILTFYPYCSDPDMDFRNILKEFVQKLAQKMRTVVLASGNVSKLTAPDWYDDGPCDLTEKFPFVLDGSDFRKRLMEMDMPELLSAMEKAVEPLGLNELTVPFFIFLPEMVRCRKLMDALFPYVLRMKSLPSDVLLKYLEALQAAGSFQMLETLVPRIMEHTLDIYNAYSYWAIKDWIELLIRISPSKALSVLRMTRPKGVHTWEEDEAERIAAAGTAYLMLNRRKQAAGLFSVCLKKEPDAEVREYCSRQLEELKGQ